jgi:hypothetical protein
MLFHLLVIMWKSFDLWKMCLGIKCVSCFSITFMLNTSCSEIFSELYLRYTKKRKIISSMLFRHTNRQREKHNKTKLVGNFFQPTVTMPRGLTFQYGENENTVFWDVILCLVETGWHFNLLPPPTLTLRETNSFGMDVSKFLLDYKTSGPRRPYSSIQMVYTNFINDIFFWWNVTFYPLNMSSHIYKQNMPLLLTPILNH